MTARLSRLVASLLAAAVLLTGCDFDGAYDLPLPGSPVDADEAIEVTADFADVLNVVPRSPVKVDDVTVGEVTEVERVGWRARVTLRLREDVKLPDNAIAEIRQLSLLGEKYVAVLPPEDTAPTGRLEDGDAIALRRTGANPEVEEVLGALSFLLHGGREDRLKTLLGSLDDVVGTLDDQKGDIINALESVNSLTATLNREKRTIQGALDVTGPAVKVLADQHQELIAMLRSLDRLGVVGTRVIRASKDDLLASLRSLRPVLANLRKAGDNLAPGLNLLVSFPFPKEASEIVLGDYANTFIKADISLDNVLPGGELPGLPNLPELPIPDVTQCLASGNVASKACMKVLGSLNLLPVLTGECKKPANRDNAVCRLLGGGGGGGGAGGGNGPLPGLGDLLGSAGFGRLTTSLSSGEEQPATDESTLLGGAR